MGYRWFMLFALLLPLIGVAPAAGQEAGREEMGRQIKQTLEQIQQVQQQRQQIKEQHRAEVDPIEQQIARLERQLQQAQAKAKEQQKKADQLERSISNKGARLGAITQRLSKAAGTVRDAVDSMRDRVRTGIPFRRDQRLEELTSVVRRLATGEPSKQADGISDFFSFAGEEFRLARTRKLQNSTVRPANDTRIHAYQLRLGLVGQVFLSENGEQFGIAARGAGQPWLTDLGPRWRDNVQQAIGMLRNRQSTELVRMPFRPVTQSLATQPETEEDD